jgi:hypothetical protein
VGNEKIMKKVDFLTSLITGAIGKEYVVKHYGKRVVVTRYPYMKGIIPSRKQKMRRSLFRKAVAYAQAVYADPVIKETKRRLLRRPKRLFQALMKEWFRKRRERKMLNQTRVNRWRRNIELNSGDTIKKLFHTTSLDNAVARTPGYFTTTSLMKIRDGLPVL